MMHQNIGEQSAQKERWLYSILGGLTGFVLVMGIMERGLFYIQDVYKFGGMFFCALFALYLYVWFQIRKKSRLWYDPFYGQGFFLYMIPLLLSVIYALQFIGGNPISLEGTFQDMIRFGFISVFAAVCLLLGRKPLGKRWLAASIQVAGWLLVISGLSAVCGLFVLPYTILRTDDPLISFAGARLSGVLEYPNAYAALVGMFLLERLAAATSDFSCSGKGARERVILSSLALYPAATALLLSESRGAWLAACVCAAAMLLLQQRGQRLLLLCAGAAPLLAAAVTHRALAGASLAPATIPGLLWLAGGEIAALTGALLLHALLARGRRVAAAAVSTASLASCAWLVIHTASARMTSGETWVSREVMWQDAARFALHSPWLGHGGEAWKHAVHTVQSAPYAGNEIHSAYLDMWIDTGLIGLMLMASLFLYIGRLLWRYAPELLPAGLILILHGGIDFDFSYTVFWMILILLGALALPVRLPRRDEFRKDLPSS
ncbi:O-antigen ligase family protein [Paenibacillus gallinarum]|uniref:O-antigen ligase family protein n=1 Tax=Paenibacillus gallinarum TaxID=2762232 RepID=A0ABR8T5Z8_9BACL|nr:O-antigen ligase family protein [Paenibacillus gallinarum]MBD7970709.1 O-antigen ligase family protein [Paenibacillus gallinarum]